MDASGLDFTDDFVHEAIMVDEGLNLGSGTITIGSAADSKSFSGLIDQIVILEGSLERDKVEIVQEAILTKGVIQAENGLMPIKITKTSVSEDGSAIDITWESIPGERYRVSGASNLNGSPRNWPVLVRQIEAVAGETTIRLPLDARESKGFYVVEHLILK